MNEYATVFLNQKFHAGITLAAYLEVARDPHNKKLTVHPSNHKPNY